MIRQFYYVREKYLDRFEKIINKEMGVADFEIGNFRINENLFYTIKEAIEVRDAIIDYVLTNYSKEVLNKLRYSIVSVEIDENVIDERKCYRIKEKVIEEKFFKCY